MLEVASSKSPVNVYFFTFLPFSGCSESHNAIDVLFKTSAVKSRWYATFNLTKRSQVQELRAHVIHALHQVGNGRSINGSDFCAVYNCAVSKEFTSIAVLYR